MGKRMNMPLRLKKLRPGNPHLIPPIFNDWWLVSWGQREDGRRWPKRPWVPKPGDCCAAPLHTWSSVTLVWVGGTLHVTVSPDVVATLIMDVGANNSIWFLLFKELSCLNFGPSSEPGVNKGLGLLFFLFRVFVSASFSFPFILFMYMHIIPSSPKDSNSPVVFLRRRHSSLLYFTGNPSLC